MEAIPGLSPAKSRLESGDHQFKPKYSQNPPCNLIYGFPTKSEIKKVLLTPSLKVGGTPTKPKANNKSVNLNSGTWKTGDSSPTSHRADLWSSQRLTADHQTKIPPTGLHDFQSKSGERSKRTASKRGKIPKKSKSPESVENNIDCALQWLRNNFRQSGSTDEFPEELLLNLMSPIKAPSSAIKPAKLCASPPAASPKSYTRTVSASLKGKAVATDDASPQRRPNRGSNLGCINTFSTEALNLFDLGPEDFDDLDIDYYYAITPNLRASSSIDKNSEHLHLHLPQPNKSFSSLHSNTEDSVKNNVDCSSTTSSHHHNAARDVGCGDTACSRSKIPPVTTVGQIIDVSFTSKAEITSQNIFSKVETIAENGISDGDGMLVDEATHVEAVEVEIHSVNSTTPTKKYDGRLDEKVDDSGVISESKFERNEVEYGVGIEELKCATNGEPVKPRPANPKQYSAEELLALRFCTPPPKNSRSVCANINFQLSSSHPQLFSHQLPASSNNFATYINQRTKQVGFINRSTVLSAIHQNNQPMNTKLSTSLKLYCSSGRSVRCAISSAKAKAKDPSMISYQGHSQSTNAKTSPSKKQIARPTNHNTKRHHLRPTTRHHFIPTKRSRSWILKQQLGSSKRHCTVFPDPDSDHPVRLFACPTGPTKIILSIKRTYYMGEKGHASKIPKFEEHGVASSFGHAPSDELVHQSRTSEIVPQQSPKHP